MRNIFKFLAVIFTFVAFASCQSEETALKEEIVGDWHYSAVENGIYMDVWLSLSPDGTFKLYQLVGKGAYWSSTGTYTVDTAKSIISGRYSDMTMWAHDYEFDIIVNTLKMTAVDAPSHVVKYRRKAIPSDVIEKTLPLTKASTLEVVPFL